jgi:hypothetical protein
MMNNNRPMPRKRIRGCQIALSIEPLSRESDKKCQKADVKYLKTDVRLINLDEKLLISITLFSGMIYAANLYSR